MIINPNLKLKLGVLLGSLLIILTVLFPAGVPSPVYSQQGEASGAQNLSNNPGNSTDAQITLYQNNVYVVWTDDTTGNGDIYYKRSVDNGTSFWKY